MVYSKPLLLIDDKAVELCTNILENSIKAFQKI